MFSASNCKTSHSKTYRAIVWLLVISSLACWELAATRFQGCSLGNPDLRACQSIDMYALDSAVVMPKHKSDQHQSAQLLALTSHPLVISPLKIVQSIPDLIPNWQPHYDAPPTPPPDVNDSTFFA